MGTKSSGYEKTEVWKRGYEKFGYEKAGYEKTRVWKNLGMKIWVWKCGYEKSGYEKAGVWKIWVWKCGYEKAGYEKAGYEKIWVWKTGYESEGMKSPGMKWSALKNWVSLINQYQYLIDQFTKAILSLRINFFKKHKKILCYEIIPQWNWNKICAHKRFKIAELKII